MLKLVGVSKMHQSGDIQTKALERIDLEIEAGEYVAITGPSGCGKSTLLGLLGLLDIPSHGEYWFEGQNVELALVAGPVVLLADEPTGNLDTAHGNEVMRLLRSIDAKGTTVVMVTHSPEPAALASRTLHLLDGRVMVDALQAA